MTTLEYEIRPHAQQLCGQLPNACGIVSSIAKIDLDIPAFGPAELLKLLSEAGDLYLAIRVFFRVGHYDTDSPQPICLLRACHGRQGDGNSAKTSE